MKVANLRAQWVREGTVLTMLPANAAMTPEEMHTYYGGERRGTANHRRLRQPCAFSRIVLLTTDHRFLLIPVTPDIVVFPMKETS